MYVPVTPYMCHLPHIHTDLQILMAFVDCPNSDIFQCEGVVAVVTWAWNEERKLSSFRMCLSVLELINFMVINVLMDETSATAKSFSDGPMAYSNGIISLVIWLIALHFEVFQIIGYYANHSIRRYVSSPRQWFGWVVLAMTGGFIIVFLTPNMQQSWNDPGTTESSAFSALLGVLLFLKWFRMLIYLRQYESIAVHTLPITTTMWNVGPFLLVMAVYVFASVNLFYGLENGYGLEECFIIIYRLVVLGDFSLLELENRSVTEPRTEYYHFVRVMVVGLSFVVSVTMMNLFIAVLCVAYDDAAKRAHMAFMESLASIVLDQHAIRKGILYVRKCRCLKRRRSRNVVRAGQDSEELEEDPDVVQDQVREKKSVMLTALDVVKSGSMDSTFLWIVRPSDSE
jgi:putative Mn2+ efflux pump MntP